MSISQDLVEQRLAFPSLHWVHHAQQRVRRLVQLNVKQRVRRLVQLNAQQRLGQLNAQQKALRTPKRARVGSFASCWAFVRVPLMSTVFSDYWKIAYLIGGTRFMWKGIYCNLNDKDGYAGTARFYSPNLTVIAI
jgi:hypothetical protein